MGGDRAETTRSRQGQPAASSDARFRPQGVCHELLALLHQHDQSERELVRRARGSDLTLLDDAWREHDRLEREIVYRWATVGDAVYQAAVDAYDGATVLPDLTPGDYTTCPYGPMHPIERLAP